MHPDSQITIFKAAIIIIIIIVPVPVAVWSKA
jgi:hypothetical protein